ncbi:MAG: DUF3488 domain-containing protein [Opitutaceae bacterium]|nr:DUF3488 domain-containing protein [Opitutaceae bacterium]
MGLIPPAPRRPHLAAEELQHLKWLLGGLLTLISLGAVFYLDLEALMLTGVAALCTLAAMVRPRLLARVPRLLHTLAFPLVTAFFIGDVWLRSEVLPAMVRLCILLLLYRNITYRQRRDELQLIVLGLFLVMVAGVLSVSPTFAVQLLAFAACALGLLLAITLAELQLTPAARAPVPPGETPMWARRAEFGHLIRRMRAVLDWRIAALGAVLFAGVVGMSALLFLSIPRFQLENSMFLERFIEKKAKTGFSETIRFGDVTEIQQDTSVALSVDVSNVRRIPASPYWRMLVLDSYQNGVFRASAEQRRNEFDPERAGTIAPGGLRPRRGEATYWTFYLEAGVSRFLPLAGAFQTLTFQEAQHFRVAPRLAMVALREEPVTMVAYRVEDFEMGQALPDTRFANRWSARGEQGTRAAEPLVRLALSDADQAALGEVIVEATGGAKVVPADFVRRVGEWLRQRHPYSLKPSIPAGDGDPLVRWLRSRESGHCELFAGSMVLLARSAGLPARVVTGFRGGSWNGYSNNFTIRNSDAHGWAEVFDETAGAWIRADPLDSGLSEAAQNLHGEAAVASRLDRSWKARVDSLRVFWYRRIVSFDQRAQAETLRGVKDATRSVTQELRARIGSLFERAKTWLVAPWDLRRAFGSAAAMVGAGLTTWWLIVRGPALWRRLSFRRGAGREDPVRREAGRWLGRLAETEPEPDHAGVRQELQRLRFGPRASWTEPEAVFRRARKTCRAARPRQRPGRRRTTITRP